MPFAGSVTRGLTAHRSTSGTLDFSGEGSTFAVELVQGAFSFAGSLVRKLSAHRSLSGAMDASGTVERAGTFHRADSGDLNFGSGELYTSQEFFEAVAGVLGTLTGAVAAVLNPVVQLGSVGGMLWRRFFKY